MEEKQTHDFYRTTEETKTQVSGKIKQGISNFKVANNDQKTEDEQCTQMLSAQGTVSQVAQDRAIGPATGV